MKPLGDLFHSVFSLLVAVAILAPAGAKAEPSKPNIILVMPDDLDELRDIGVDYLSYGDRQIPYQAAPAWQRDWETCMTLNGAWGFNAGDNNWKSPQTVVQMLAEVVSKGGNFLLNFGPTAAGELPAEGVKVVRQVGDWLRVNGEAIYGAGPSDLISKASAGKAQNKEPAVSPINWLATSRAASPQTGQPAKIYLHIFKWPEGQLEVNGMTSQVSKAYFLSDAKRTPLKLSQRGKTFSVELSGHAPDPVATVICLESATK
jgi:alpha-L-fucosidase